MITKYDSVFLGSSPLHLMCHQELQKRGLNSLIIEQEEKIGGAWYTSSIWGVNQLEMGCHILKNIQKGVDKMNSYGASLEIMDTQPTVIFRKLRGESFMNTMKIWFLQSTKLFSSNKLHSKFKVAKIEALTSKHKATPYHYHKNGCFGLVENLMASSSITKATIQEINQSGEVISLILSNGEKVETARLLLPKNYKVDRFSINDTAITFDYSVYVSEHYVLHYKNPISAISFVDIVGDDLVNLISQTGIYSDNPNESVIAVSIKKAAGRVENNLTVSDFSELPSKEEQEKNIAQIKQKLIDFKILNAFNELLEWHYEPYFLNVKKNPESFDLEKLSDGKIISFDTTDLIESVINNPILNGNL